MRKLSIKLINDDFDHAGVVEYTGLSKVCNTYVCSDIVVVKLLKCTSNQTMNFDCLNLWVKARPFLIFGHRTYDTEGIL